MGLHIFIVSGCSSTKNAVEIIDVCTKIKDPSHSLISTIQDDLNKKAYQKFIYKYKSLKGSQLFFTDTFYHSKDNLNSLCLRTKISSAPEIKWKYKTLHIKNSCYNASDVKLSNSIEKAVDFSLKTAVSKNFPEMMNKDWNIVKNNIFDIKHSEPDINLKNNTICLDVKAKIYTDVISIDNTNQKSQNHKFEYIEDFSGFKLGDKADQYGKKIIIQQSNTGNGLSTLNKKGSFAIFNAGLKKNIKVKIYIQNQWNQNPIVSKKIQVAKLIYANKSSDKIEVKTSPYIFNSVKADIYIGGTKSEESNFPIASNYDVVSFTKKRREMRFFINGRFMGRFYLNGDIVSKISIPVSPDVIIDAVEIKETD